MTTKVTSEFLHQAIISDHTQVSAADADHLLIHDASDNTLKKALVSTITGSSSSAADDITAGDAAVTISTSAGNITIDNGSSDDDIIFKGTDGGSDITALTLDMSAGGDAIFGGKIQADGALKFNSNTGTPEFQFFGSGTETGVINLGSSNFNIESKVSDKDIIFKGVDGSSNVTALTLDMSEGGNAHFNANVLLNTAGKYYQMAGSSSTYWAIGSTGGQNPPGTASTSLAFHHWDGSAWNNEVEFSSAGNITADGNLVLGGTATFKFINNGWINSGEGDGRIYYANSGETYFKADGSHLFRKGDDTTIANIDTSGNGTFAGNVTAYGSPSDIVLKENVSVIDNAMEKVNQLKGITYDLKSDGNRLTGLVAQDLEKVLPEAVYTAEDLEGKEHLAIRYGNTVGLLVEAIKELSAKIEKLEGK